MEGDRFADLEGGVAIHSQGDGLAGELGPDDGVGAHRLDDPHLAVRRVMAGLAAIALPLVLLLWAFAPWAFERLFGTEWRGAGELARTLGLYIGVHFVAAPLVDPVACNADSNFCTSLFGDLGRNIYRGPHQQNWDFSLIKNFKLTERQSMRFSTDFFNIWNHANFANPGNGTATDVEIPSAFGRIFSTVGTPRLIQFSLRYAF